MPHADVPVHGAWVLELESPSRHDVGEAVGGDWVLEK